MSNPRVQVNDQHMVICAGKFIIISPSMPILGEVGLAIVYTLSDVINGHITDRKFGS